MKGAGILTFLYALLVFAGGIMGRVKAGSHASLITGVICGIILFFLSWGIFKDHLFSTYLAILVILGLAAFFTYRWLMTYAFFPAGMMAILSTLVLLVVIFIVYNHLKK